MLEQYKDGEIKFAGFSRTGQKRVYLCSPKTDGCKGCFYASRDDCRGHELRCKDVILKRRKAKK